MSPVSDITGVILCGGRSSRFGENKALAPIRGEPMVKQVLEVMESVFAPLLMVTNRPEEYAAFNIAVVSDLVPDQGPMGGIVTAFHHSSNDRLFVVGCDMPVLDPSVIRKLIEADERFDAVVPVHDGRGEYLMALYSRTIFDPMREALNRGERSIRKFLSERPNIRWIPLAGNSAYNVNTRDDLQRLEETDAV